MSLLEELRELGVDVDGALKRLNNNAALYERLLGKLAQSMDSYYVSPDFDGQDYADVIERAHAMKGTTGNLSITPLYEAYSEIVRLLRAEQPEEAREKLKNTLPVQEKIMSCIGRNIQ